MGRKSILYKLYIELLDKYEKNLKPMHFSSLLILLDYKPVKNHCFNKYIIGLIELFHNNAKIME